MLLLTKSKGHKSNAIILGACSKPSPIRTSSNIGLLYDTLPCMTLYIQGQPLGIEIM
jgi:hypothetical protein